MVRISYSVNPLLPVDMYSTRALLLVCTKIGVILDSKVLISAAAAKPSSKRGRCQYTLHHLCQLEDRFEALAQPIL